jgi:hypothetical protein
MYRVAKGGAITIESFLNENDRDFARNYMLKTASSTMREAAKIGLQSLYADPEDVLEKYKDFDIVKEMQARKGAKLLWVRARAIDADVVNANGDYFSKEELLKEVEIKGEKIPSYKTFEGVPIYTNHKNDDIEQAKGMVVYAEWDEKEDCVYCTFFVDEEAYPDIARNIRTGVIHDVSMGASVEYGICSKCSNKAYTEKDYCECLKKYKGRTHPDTGKKIYEKNFDVKFIELSCVGDGAFESCEIQEIYDVEDVLDAAQNLEKKAQEICSNIVLAHQGAPKHGVEKYQYEHLLRVAENTATTAIRLAQSAGTLVGGPLLAGQGANQNSTVSAILQGLGIDPRSGLNVLDMINLSLNFLEVAVMNMFARKDNVDLTHVGKITKAMADLQSTMQDMIDDGVDVGAGQRAPMNQGQLQQQQQSNPISANVGLADYSPAGDVGRMIEPMVSDSSEPVGGGVALASSDVHFVWASTDGKREVFASNKTSKPQPKNKVMNMAENLMKLKNSIGDEAGVQNSINNVIRLANERNKFIKSNTPKNNEAEVIHQMDHFTKIAAEQRKKLAAAVTIDFKVEDNTGNRVVLSTDGSISGYVENKRTNWNPILSEKQLEMMESGQGTRVAADLLKDFSGFIKTALLPVKSREESRQKQLDEVRTGEGYGKWDVSVQDKLSDQYRDDLLDLKENLLDGSGDGVRRTEKHESGEKALSDAGLYKHNVIDKEVNKTYQELLEDSRKGVDERTIEEKIRSYHKHGTAPSHEVMTATVRALAKAVVAAVETPSQIIRVAQLLSQEPELPSMIGVASEGQDFRQDQDEKQQFFGAEKGADTGVAAVLKQLGAAVTMEITAADLAEALAVAAEESEITKEGVKRIAEIFMGQANVPGEGLDVDAVPSKNEELRSALMAAVDSDDKLPSKEDVKSAISAMAQSSEETGTTPDEVVDVIASMTKDQLIKAISKAKTATATDARLRSRARREFWGVKTASTKDVATNVVGWLADYSTNFNIGTRSIVTAAKRFVSDPEVAERLLIKAIQAKKQAESGMKVTQDKSETMRFMCTVDDLDGANPSDENFDETFKQKAIQVLSEKGYQVDPGTFSFTDLCVFEDGRVEASVSTRSTKTFDVEGSSSMPMEGSVDVAVVESPVVMTEGARFSRTRLRNEVLAKYAQVAPGMGGGMGAPMGGAPGAAPMGDPMGAPPAPAGADLGVSALTGGPDAMGEDMDAVSEPGAKKPWGSVCPVCGSDDVNIAESNADCQSCGSTYKILQSLELVSEGGKGGSEPSMDEGLGGAELGGAGLGEAGLGAATAPAPAPGMGAGNMAPMASAKLMLRLATVVDADVYLRTASPDFDRTTEKRLPVGMICPKCGNRNAHKVKSSTFCYDCGTYSKTEVRANTKNPSKLDATITWID